MADHPARDLFRVSPGGYVAERSRMAKLARATGDRALAQELASLKRPSLAMWAIVAAGDDHRRVTELLEVTDELAAVQSSGDRPGTVEVTHRRKAVLESVVAAAVASLRSWEPSAEARRPEIRTMVDQLSRHPELGRAWIDGTLRELPDTDGFGFAAFTGMEVRDVSPAPPGGPRRPREPGERRLRSVPDLAPDGADSGADSRVEAGDDGERERQRLDRADRVARERAAREARAARAVAAREARRDVDAAMKELAAAQRKFDAAQQALREANEVMDAAEVVRDAASQRHVDATVRLAALAELAASNDLTLVDGDA